MAGGEGWRDIGASVAGVLASPPASLPPNAALTPQGGDPAPHGRRVAEPPPTKEGVGGSLRQLVLERSLTSLTHEVLFPPNLTIPAQIQSLVRPKILCYNKSTYVH
jgi:hypothetical protein